MKTINRNDVTDADFINLLQKEAHHDHELILDDGIIYWKEVKEARKAVDEIGMNQLMHLFGLMGFNRNSEPIRKLYRDIGYSLFGYWELFYCETNNPEADQYIPEMCKTEQQICQLFGKYLSMYILINDPKKEDFRDFIMTAEKWTIQQYDQYNTVFENAIKSLNYLDHLHA